MPRNPAVADERWQRLMLGVLSIGLVIGGAIAYWGFSAFAGTAGTAIKVGLILGVIYVAYPQLQFLPRWLIGAILLVAVVLAVRPKLMILLGRVMLIGVPAYWVLWMLGARLRDRGSQHDSSTRAATGRSERRRDVPDTAQRGVERPVVGKRKDKES